jgi:fermentation-respiration switch protein FrsA (DUF1100 family)
VIIPHNNKNKELTMRKDIKFKTDDGLTLRGWLYVPDGANKPVPTIVMAHGFSCLKEMFLDKYAEVFVKDGLAVLVYDNRNFGDSDGEPRLEVDPMAQVRDYQSAISFAETLPEVDKNRIGIWGTSYTGGHVLIVAAIDKRVKCVVSQVPVVSGARNIHRAVREDSIPKLLRRFYADRAARFAGKPPAMVPVASLDPNEVCAFPGTDAFEAFQGAQQTVAPTWRNEVTLRSLELFMAHETIGYVEQIGPVPLLMIVEDADTLGAVDQSLDIYNRAHEPKKLVLFHGGHFDAYVRDQRVTAEAARDWYVEHLIKDKMN